MSPARLPIKHHPNLRHLRRTVLIVVFVAVIYLPGIGMMVLPQRAPSQGGWEESRSLPKLSWQLSSITSFPKDFGEYFRFNFAFRRNLIRWHAALAGEALGKSTSPLVMEGKHGWLFYGEQQTIEDYRGLLPFPPEQLQRWQQALEQRRDWLAERGIHYLFVICPEKQTIYPEYMPDRLNRVHDQTRLDQFVRYMREHSTVEILDLRPALLELKLRHLCYQPQETHWNGVGAFAGYQQIARRLRTWYPDLHVIEMDECEYYQRENVETDLLRLQGKKNIRTSLDAVRPVQGFSVRLRKDPNDIRTPTGAVLYGGRGQAPIPRALVVCDSFTTLMMPFLSEHFGDVMYVWGGGDGFRPQDVLNHRPEVVIQELVERSLWEMTLHPLELPPADATPCP